MLLKEEFRRKQRRKLLQAKIWDCIYLVSCIVVVFLTVYAVSIGVPWRTLF